MKLALRLTIFRHIFEIVPGVNTDMSLQSNPVYCIHVQIGTEEQVRQLIVSK